MRERISISTAFWLIATSSVFQLIGVGAGLVPGLGTIWEWFGYLVIFVWFFILGVKFMSGEKAMQKLSAMGGGFIIDSLPFLGSLPAQLASVVIVIFITRAEDKKARRKHAAQIAAQKAGDLKRRNKNDWSWREDDRAANDNGPDAANDNEEEDRRSA